jgi:HK97 family phage portal protein
MRNPLQVFAAGISAPVTKTLSPPDSRGSWTSIIREPFSGAWQKNEELSADACLSNFAVFSCRTLIGSDVSKNRIRLVAQNGQVWQETTNAAFSPVLRKPNEFQNRIQFIENWIGSKLDRGNTYVLKRRDGRGVVVALYILNPDRVQPLVSDDGQVFYRLSQDNLAAITEADVIVPAREIIHDRFNCLFHPLVGISPLYAAALAATQGTNIQRSSARLASNGVRPGGILTAPGKIDPDNAKRLKETWESQYAGPSGAAKIAILGDGLKFESLTMTADEAQLIEQLKFTAEMICSVYHVPPYKIGVGPLPSYNNVQALNVEYFSQCLQKHIEDIELCLDEGLGIGEGVTINGQVYGTEFDVDNLLRMDSATLMDVLDKGKNYFTPDEGRAKIGYGPKPGGDAVYRQQQDYSLEALAKRDATDDPFGKAAPAVPTPVDDNAANDNAAAAQRAMALVTIAKGLAACSTA